MSGPWEGMTLEGRGTWSLDGERVRYTDGERSGSSAVRVEGSRLWLDPDFGLRRDGSVPIASEYERASEA